MDQIKGHAYSAAAKRSRKKAVARQRAEMVDQFALAPSSKREGNGRLSRSGKPRDPMIETLKARCRRWGFPSGRWREMRDPWWGCEAGGAMALDVLDREDRAKLWDAICHMRRVITDFDRAIGAPNRHARCLRLLLPLDALEADSTSPPPDGRTDREREDSAVMNLQWLEEWLGRAGHEPMMEACRAVWDDQRPRNVGAMLAALWSVSAEITRAA